MEIIHNLSADSEKTRQAIEQLGGSFVLKVAPAPLSRKAVAEIEAKCDPLPPDAAEAIASLPASWLIDWRLEDDVAPKMFRILTMGGGLWDFTRIVKNAARIRSVAGKAPGGRSLVPFLHLVDGGYLAFVLDKQRGYEGIYYLDPDYEYDPAEGSFLAPDFATYVEAMSAMGFVYPDYSGLHKFLDSKSRLAPNGAAAWAWKKWLLGEG